MEERRDCGRSLDRAKSTLCRNKQNYVQSLVCPLLVNDSILVIRFIVERNRFCVVLICIFSGFFKPKRTASLNDITRCNFFIS